MHLKPALQIRQQEIRRDARAGGHGAGGHRNGSHGQDRTCALAHAVEAVVGEEGHVYTPQSLGGEDFAWYLESVPGAMARLGTRTPGGPTYDLHQGDLRVDEAATAVGAKVLAAAAIEALAEA